MASSRACPRLIVMALCLHGSVAAAQGGRDAEAEALFQQGKDLMTRGAYAEACKKFQSSHDLSPRASTLMNLGACQEANRKLVSAWYAFVEAAKLADRSPDTRELAGPSRERAKALAARRSSIEIVVVDAARTPGLSVTRDGAEVLEGQWNTEVYVDGGEYEIVARATGTDAWTNRISVASELDKKRIEIPVLAPRPEPIPSPTLPTSEPQALEATPAVPAASSPGTEPVPTDPGDTGLTGMRKASIAAGVVGVAAVAGGVFFAIGASDKQSQADAICPTATCDDPMGLALNSEARSAAQTANLLLIGGGVAIAGGVGLWLLGAPPSGRRGDLALRPHLGSASAGLHLSGVF